MSWLSPVIYKLLCVVFWIFPIAIILPGFSFGNFAQVIFIELSFVQVLLVYVLLAISIVFAYMSGSRALLYASFSPAGLYTYLVLIGNGFTFGF